MGTGDNAGTWGAVTNVNLGTALEESIAGTVDVAFSSSDITLTLTDDNTAQAARNMRLNLTGTSGGARNLIVPAIEKMYVVNNGLADACTVKVSGQTGVAVPAGKTTLLFNNGTDIVNAINALAGLTTTADINFGDNDKAIFGAGSDLQIYHNGANSYIDDTGTGSLYIRASDTVRLQSATGEQGVIVTTDGAVTLYHDNGAKLATTATGIDVTGTVVSDGLTVDTDTLYVDSTNNRVGIGTGSPTASKLHIDGGDLRIQDVTPNIYFYSEGAVNNIQINANISDAAQGGIAIYENSNALIKSRTSFTQFYSANTERMRIDGSGNVGIGTASPVKRLTISGASNGNITTLTDAATITPNLDSSDMFTVTLGGNRTLANPSNRDAGQTGSIFIVQDGTGSRTLAWGSYWDFAGGTAPTLSTAAGAVDRVDFIVRTSTSIHAVFTANYS